MEVAQLKERRAADRVPYAIQVMIVHGELAWAADVRDLSEGGCGVFRPAGCLLREGNVARLLFFEGPGPAVPVSARIARITERHIGFEYHEPQTIPPCPP
ncbi:MAG: PilZ domain-containing protein [Pseudomonadota bacterium]